jgi:hypothetical protein
MSRIVRSATGSFPSSKCPVLIYVVIYVEIYVEIYVVI